MLFDQVIALANLILAIITLAIVLWFWWQQRHAGVSNGWRLLAFALLLFTIGQVAKILAENHPDAPLTQVGAAISVLYMGIFLAALYRLFEDVVNTQRNSISQAQEIIELQNEGLQRAQEAETLIQIAENLISSLKLETVMQELCRHTRELLCADSVSVRLPRPTREGFRFAVDFASALKSRPERLDPAIDDLAWRVLHSGRPALIPDAKAHPLFGPQSPPWLGALALYPLSNDDDTIGVLTAVFDQPRSLSPREQRLMSALANYAAIAVHNAYLYEQVEHQARMDGLTGLYNRHVFNRTLQEACARSRAEGNAVALLLCDMDNLKAINDRYGHTVGDEALIAAANALRERQIPGAILARFGGDEFAVLLSDTSAEEAAQVASDLQDALSHLHIHHGMDEVDVCMSVGWAVQQGASCNATGIVESADKRLYAVKEQHHLASSRRCPR